MPDITEPLILARGSHKAGSGKGCAMNVISWENGDTEITDYPECSDRLLTLFVQLTNDLLAGPDGLLNAKDSIIALDLGHATVGTAYHELSDDTLIRVYARITFRLLYGMQVPTGSRFWDVVRMWLNSDDMPRFAMEQYLYNGAHFIEADDRRDDNGRWFFAAAMEKTTEGAADMFGRMLREAYEPRDEGFYEYEPGDGHISIAKYMDVPEATLKPSYTVRRKERPRRGRYEWADMARAGIAQFHFEAGTAAKTPEPEVVACAVESMLQTV